MAENSIQIPAVKTQFSDIIRNADQFRMPSQEELQAHRNSRPFLIITCPAAKVIPPKDTDKFIDQSNNPLILESEYNWAFRYFSGKNDDPIRAEASMTHSLFANPEEEDTAPLPTPENQSSLTAIEVIVLCSSFGWSEVHIEDGSERCKFSVWATCKILNIPCFGFDASDYDQNTRFNNAKDHIQTVLQVHDINQQLVSAPSPKAGGISSNDEETEV